MGAWEEAKARAREALGRLGGALGAAPEPSPGDVVVVQRGGVRFMTFGTEWVQGAMRLSRPDQIELEYARRMMGWMLFVDDPRLVVQMGLGAGALAKFCLRWFPKVEVSVAERDAAVLAVCRSHFALPDSDRLEVAVQDAWAYARDPARMGRACALQVDLYDAQARGPVLDSEAFYRDCHGCLADGGWMCVNLFGDDPGFEGSLGRISMAFGPVWTLGRHGEGNVVAMARRGGGEIDLAAVKARAERVERETLMEATSWAADLDSQGPAGRSDWRGGFKGAKS